MGRPIPPAGRADHGSSRTLSLLVPGLTAATWPDRPAALLEGLDLAALQRMLARATRVEYGGNGLEAELRRRFGFAVEDGFDEDFPVAALTLYSDSGARPDGYWLRADPVHIEAGQDRLIMTGGEGLDIGAEEAAELCAALNGHFAEEGIELIAPTPGRWYFRWPRPPEVRFPALPEVVGGDLYPHMPGGEAGRPWRRRLNEIQMVLHDHPVNRQRRAQGGIEINGVWIWGGGELAAGRPCGYSAVRCHDPLLRGLARNAGVEDSEPPEDANRWLAARRPGHELIMPDDLDRPLLLGDLEQWRARLTDLHRRWFAPLETAVRRGAIDELIVSPATGAGYHVSRRTMRRWWRRGRLLTEIG